MNKQIGFYCPHITNSPEHQLIIDVLNGLSTGITNTIMFNTIYEPVANNRKFCLLPSVGAKYFNGVLFCFDIDSLSVINNFPSPSHKILITDNIFWKNKGIPTSYWTNLLDSNISIITTSQNAYDMYDICFKTPIMNMNNGLNLEECNNVLQRLS
jgi:hypothetical protein